MVINLKCVQNINGNYYRKQNFRTCSRNFLSEINDLLFRALECAQVYVFASSRCSS